LSCKNASILYYSSDYIEWVCIVFMFLAGTNFTLIWQMLQRKWGEVRENSEFKSYVGIVLAASAIAAFSIYSAPEPFTRAGGVPGGGLVGAIRLGLFHVISILTTTGFAADDHSLWPPLAQTALFMLMFIGGCSGSTAGGVKVIRYTILGKQMANELKRMIYPRGVFGIQVDGRPGRKDVVRGIVSFMFTYFILILAGSLLVASAGAAMWDAANTSLIMVGNIGLGLGKLSNSVFMISLPDYVKYGLSFLMITGRLEMLTVMVLFTKAFWTRR
jgi:trk system potassium uptake protein TrkH